MVQRSANKINETYFAYALANLIIDQDARGTFATVPSERKGTYRVDIDESDPRDVHAVKCYCPATVPCKHLQIVNAFFHRILRHYAQQEEVVETVSIGEAMAAATETMYATENEAYANYLLRDCYQHAPSHYDLDVVEQEHQLYRNYEMQIGVYY